MCILYFKSLNLIYKNILIITYSIYSDSYFRKHFITLMLAIYEKIITAFI